MTTPTITDEQIAEIEALATGGNVPRWGSMVMCCGTVLDLICRLRAAERDAARYRLVRGGAYVSGRGWSFACGIKPLGQYDYNLAGHAKLAALDAAIDAAMALPEPNPPA